VPEYLSQAWFEALATALDRLHLSGAEVPSDGLAIGQLVTGVPETADAVGVDNGEVRYTIVVGESGSTTLIRGSVELASVVIVADWPSAFAISSGASSVSEMLSAGKIKLRGDARALVAAADLLATLARVVATRTGAEPDVP
jgi:hypothetical protein